MEGKAQELSLRPPFYEKKKKRESKERGIPRKEKAACNDSGLEIERGG